jgi:RND family efflux transporter MFP subunit
MSGNRSWLPAALLGGAALAMVVLWNLNPVEVEEQVAAGRVPVEVVTLHPSSQRFVIESQGTITAHDTTSLVAEVSGRVVEFSSAFQVGRFFHKDEVLLRIDDVDYRATVEKAEAVLAQERAKLAAELARAEQAQADIEALGRTGQVSELALRTPYVEEAKASVESARADLVRARIKLDRTEVQAPYDGFVLSRDVGLGQFLTAGANIGRVFSAEKALVRLPVTERQLAMIPLRDRRHGENAIPEEQAERQCDLLEIKLTRGREVPSGARKASICVVEAERDTESRVQYLQAQLNDPYLVYGGPAAGLPLRVGTYVVARIPSREYNDVFAVPRRAVHEGNRLLMVDDQDRLYWKTIDYFHADTDHVYVREGLAAGDRVSVSPLDVAVEGTRVEVVPAAGTGA